MNNYGRFASKHAILMLVTLIVFEVAMIAAWISSSKGIPLETNVDKLWVEKGGRLEKEMDYYDNSITKGYTAGTNVFMFLPKSRNHSELLHEDMLDDHITIMREVNKIVIPLVRADHDTLNFTYNGATINETEAGVKYTTGLHRVCDFINFPDELFLEEDKDLYVKQAKELTLCNRVTLLDCFKEGGEDFFLEDFLPVLGDLAKDYGIYGYTKLPSYKNQSHAVNFA